MNRLAGAGSPYLLQHADNPVDWYPWDEEALELARREDKPILLSIGYSACHWCHVMAHESFEDPATAKVMNEGFVNIKVDREERPDLDKIYQLAHQIIARRGGGWPLTMFLDPQTHAPFFGGTYFPKNPRYQLPAFVDLLRRVSGYFRQHRAELRDDGETLRGILLAQTRGGAATALDATAEALARRSLEQDFDPRHGGFGGAPKFPHAAGMEFLLGLWRRHGDEPALRMLGFSLKNMAEGGLYDQIGGGFCRYSVDAGWRIPHFEKMLYDNAVLLGLYARAWRATGDPLFRRVAEETAEWVLREMQSPTGGFYSSLDADSEGHEGKYYVWDRKEVRGLLELEEYAIVEPHYGLDQTPNFEGRWHLHIARPLAEVASGLGIPLAAAEARLASARAKLYRARAERVRPGLDDKLLTAWNGLMAESLAAAGRLLERPDFVAAAERALDFFLEVCRDGAGRLLAVAKDGKAHLPAYLDDYAFMLNAGLELLECRWNTAELRRLLLLADRLLEGFEDREQGGFYFTAQDHETLLHRPKSWVDESMPAGNGMAALALLRLGELVGDARHHAAAERTLLAASASLRRHPGSHGAVLLALAEWLQPAGLVVLRGAPEALPEWCAAARRAHPSRRVFAIPRGESDLPGLLAERRDEAGVVAYVCAGTSCQPPLRSLAELGAA